MVLISVIVLQVYIECVLREPVLACQLCVKRFLDPINYEVSMDGTQLVPMRLTAILIFVLISLSSLMIKRVEGQGFSDTE